MAAPANGWQAVARSRPAKRTVSGTPTAVVVLVPNELRMSLRTTPLVPRASGPFEPSPGNGPAVSAGISVVQPPALEVAVDADAEALAPPTLGEHAASPTLSPASPMACST